MIKVIRGDALVGGDATQTARMSRRQASATDRICAVEVRTAPGSTSGWHHHGGHDTFGYVISGQLRFEFGGEGREVVVAGPGDFFLVPAGVVHREANPGPEEQVLVGFRVGTGPTVVNVDGPAGIAQ